MPIGSYVVIPHISHQICLRKNLLKTFLDVGVGFGMNGVIVRQYIDDGILPFKSVLEGVEAFSGYRNPLWAMYNYIYEMPLQDVFFSKTYDCILITDVIEHFDKKQGIFQLKKLKNLLNKSGILIVSTPAIFCEQGAVHGNMYEVHRSLFTVEDFKELGFEILKDGGKDEFCNYMICAMYENK